MNSSYRFIIILLSFGFSWPVHSQSVGTTRDGHLSAGIQLPLSGPGYSILDMVRGRNFRFGSSHLIEMVKETGAAIEEANMPDLKVGNISREGGGNIPQSKSHNSGRDLDIAFYVVDKSGQSIELHDYVTFPNNLESEDGEHRFDIERNWKLVKTLLNSSKAHIAWIFVANHLRDSLLRAAENESLELQMRATATLKQPSDSAPHDDHFHIRVYCDPSELPSCIETVERLPWVPVLPAVPSIEHHTPFIPADSPTVQQLIQADPKEWNEESTETWNRLTNHQFDNQQAAVSWHASQSHKTAREWWDGGYNKANCAQCVDGHLESRVEALTEAVGNIPEVSYRARLDLSELTGNPVDTSRWSTVKASRFWRKWWKKNARRYGF